MSYFVYRVKLNPLDDAHVEYYVGFGTKVKMLTEDEANVLRDMIKDEIGKTVGKVGIDGEQYEILSTCPNIHDIHKFLDGVKSKSVAFNVYFHEKERETRKLENWKTTTTTTTTTTIYQCSPAMATCDGLYKPPM